MSSRNSPALFGVSVSSKSFGGAAGFSAPQPHNRNIVNSEPNRTARSISMTATVVLGRSGCAVLGNELGMRRHGVHTGRDDLSDAVSQASKLLIRYQVDGGVILARHNMLAQHDLNPAGDRKHFLGIAEEASAILE